MGKCWFSHENDDYSDKAQGSGVKKRTCRNGDDCEFREADKCCVLHEGDDEEDNMLNPYLHHLLRLFDNIELGMDSDHELWADEDSRKTGANKKTAPVAPWCTSLQCNCLDRVNLEQDDTDSGVLSRVAALPVELKMKILEKMDLETLIKVDLPINILRQVLNVPKKAKANWLPDFIASKDCGIIYIPEKARFSLTNQHFDEMYYDPEDFSDDSADDEDNSVYFDPRFGRWRLRQTERKFRFRMGEIEPDIEPGFYKVRILQNGFDLVKVGYHFISSQCGPNKCFPKELERNWACSYISRGFKINTECRCDMAPGEFHPRESWKLPVSPKKLDAPAFLISFGLERWKSSWTFEETRPYSVDEVALKDYKGAWRERKMSLHVLKTENGWVNGYKISGDAFAAYDPVDDYHSDEGWYQFSVTRYKYKGMKKQIGFIITGSQNDYGMPAFAADDDEPFPDKKYFKRKVKKRFPMPEFLIGK